MEPENPNQAVARAAGSADTQQQLHSELTAQLFAHLPRSALAAIGIAALTLLVVSQDAIGSRLSWWFGSVTLVSGLRLWLARQYGRKPGTRPKRWLRSYVLLTLVSGGAWSCLLLTHDAAAHSPSTVYTAVVLIGMCAGAITTMAHYAIAYIAFITPPLIGFTAWALLGLQPAQPALALATIAAFGLLVTASYRFEHAFRQTLESGIERQQLLQRLENDHAKLREAQEILLHEEEVAAYVMNSIMEPPGREDGGLKAHVQPLHRFDGDVLLNDISGKGTFRLFLGDATGHGLAAAIAVIPAAQTFRAMNRKNLDCELLIRELNGNIYRLFPRNIFLAATLIELAPRSDDGCDARIWNGGLDDLIVVREDGRLDRIRSRNLALGILEPEAFEPQFENIALARGDRLYAYSDGLTESENSAGEGFGRSRLEATLLTAPDPSARLEHVLTQQRAFIGNTALTDDLTLIELQPDAIARRIRQAVGAASQIDLPGQALGSRAG